MTTPSCDLPSAADDSHPPTTTTTGDETDTDTSATKCSATMLKKHIWKFGASLVIQLGWWIYTLTDPAYNFSRFSALSPYVGTISGTYSPYYYMSLTMILGSFVAGATSEGGGAIAFPVMTLILGIPPPVARDFSLAIQSFGMTSASISIFGLGIPVDKMALIWASFGGVLGMIIGLAFVAPNLPPPYAKMFFVSTWIVFCVALFLLNRLNAERIIHGCVLDSNKALRKHKRTKEHGDDDEVDEEAAVLWEKRKAQLILVATGTVGGIYSAFSGSGLDMATFSILTLYFRVSEKVATPTSVVLMAINAVIGTILRALNVGGTFTEDQTSTVWKFVYVCVPIVTVFAPVGAKISSMVSRLAVTYLLYFLDTLQFIVALAVIQPWSGPNALGLSLTTTFTIVVGGLFFWKVADWGRVRAVDGTEETEGFEDCEDEFGVNKSFEEHVTLEI